MGESENSSLVSVIIPAFNVEKYLTMCVESIVNQTYTNREIIIVEDGAKDSTAEVADKLAESYPSVSVIHKQNEGVSAARNTGMDHANGEYIVFVDADDYLAPDYLQYFVDMAESTHADFCLSKKCFTRANEAQIENDRIEKLSPQDGTGLLLSPEVIVGCWNKMFRTDFLKQNKLRFSTTLFYGEGLQFITKAAQLANAVAVGNRKVYYYRRNNEMSATSSFSIEKSRNGEKALLYIHDTLLIKSGYVQDMWLLHMSLYALGAITRMKTCHVASDYREDFKRWQKFIRKNYLKVASCKRVSLYRKAILLGGCICPALVAKADVIRRKKIVENSVQ